MRGGSFHAGPRCCGDRSSLGCTELMVLVWMTPDVHRQCKSFISPKLLSMRFHEHPALQCRLGSINCCCTSILPTDMIKGENKAQHQSSCCKDEFMACL